MNSIAVLLTVHNRKEVTLRCLDSLFSQDLRAGYKFDVYLTDDGCTDGTVDAILSQYPTVKIIKGNGQLFWNRGMYLAWSKASDSFEYSFFILLNDDTILFSDAIDTLVRSSMDTSSSAIICGVTCDHELKKTTYGGRLLNGSDLLDPIGALQECHIINGNCMLVPKKVFDSVGNLDYRFRHAIGDFDYGLRAQKAGYSCYITAKYIGICDANSTLPKWCLPSTPLIRRFRLLYSPLGYSEPFPFFVYEKRHFGLFIAFKHFITINLRAFLPNLWK
jgi:GT2 family glycosyltransferase